MGGVAIPLVVVAAVCLLVTSWAWLFSGDGGKSSSPARVSVEATVHPAAAGSSGPSAAASAQPPATAPSQTGTGGTSGSPSADATATAASTPPGGPLGPGPGSASQPNGGPAPDPAPGGGGTPAPPPAAGTGGTGATPPAASPPPSTPAGTQPRDIVVLVDRYATTGYIDVINPTDRPLASWKLTVVVSGSAFTVFRAEGNDGFVAHSSGTTATATSDRPLLPHEELTIYFELKAPIQSATCDLSGVACRF